MLVLAEVLFLLLRFAGDFTSGRAVDVTPDLIIPYAEECTNDERGARVENFTGVFATTRWIDIRPGSYQVSITYVTNGKDGQATFLNEVMPTAVYDPITLPAARTRTVFSLWMPNGCETAQLQFVSDCGPDQVMYITGVQLTPTHGFAYVRFLSALLFFILADYLLLLGTHRLPFPIRSVRARYSAVAMVGIVLLACIPLGLGYITYGHDLSIHLCRIDGIKQGLLAGQFPVRMDPGFINDKGYPISLMYADILLYPAAFLRILGFSLQTVYKLYVVAVTAGTALITWHVLRKMLGSESVALVGAAMYTLSLYRMTNVYLRAAVGEYTAMMFLPLVVYGLWRIYTQEQKNDKRCTPWCRVTLAVGFTGLLQCHLLTTELAALFTAVFCLFMAKRTFTRPVLPALGKAVGAAVVWNLWFLVPFAQYMITGACNISGKYTAAALQDSAAFLGQIFMMFGEPGVSDSLALGIMDEMSLSIGTVLAFGALLFLLVLLNPELKNTDRRAAKIGTWSLGLAALAIWMASDWFPWYDLYLSNNAIGQALSAVLGKLQFAWRFLSVATVLLVVCSCCALLLFGKARNKLAGPAMAVLLLFTILPAGDLIYRASRYSVVVHYQSMASVDNIYDQIGGGEYLSTAISEHMPEAWSMITPSFSDGVENSAYEKNGLTVNLSAHNTTEAEGTVVLPLFDYPGYTLSGDDGAVLSAQDGYLAVKVPAGWQGSVTVRFTGMWYWRISDLISVAGIAATLVLYRRNRKRIAGTVAASQS